VRLNREELVGNRHCGESVRPSAADDKPTACVLTYLGEMLYKHLFSLLRAKHTKHW